MDDDIEGAERGLAEGNSAFHSLCKGVLGFMKATMGFEQEVMKEASEQLSAAENAAYNNHHRAQRDSHAYQSNIYDRGAEFSLCQAEAQIMSAVVGVLNESLTESIKGFYKLRKAYMTLESLIQMENRFMKAQGVKSLANSRSQSQESLRSVRSFKSGVVNGEKEHLAPATPAKDTAAAHANQPSGLREATAVEDLDGDSDDDFYDVENEEQVTTTYQGHLERELEGKTLNEKTAEMNISDNSRPSTANSYSAPSSPPKQATATALQLLTVNADSDIFTDPLDVFIHSGTNLCFGLLSLLISAIPPAFSKLLFIIGFRGDRERGMRMLWQASKFSNINGGMAGLIILGWYNGLVGFCDIIPDPDPSILEEVEGYPAARLQALLAEMRARYPKSHLWLIEEARMAASNRQLSRSLDLLSATPGKSTLKQLEALHMFERALESMHAHRYTQTAKTFIACVDLNNWSQALYYYIAGAAHLEIYRSTDPVTSDAERQKSAKLATEYFKLAPSKAGKKKMMGRQLPFDTFVIRKIQKWEAKASSGACDFVDAIGVSPLEEMIFFWNGYKKMEISDLEHSLKNLSWSERPSKTRRPEDEPDEHAILAVLRAVILRNLRRHEESKAQLQTVLTADPATFKGHLMDDWPAPVAHYEMAVNLWMERTGYIKIYGTEIVTVGSARDFKASQLLRGELAHDANLVGEAKRYIEKAKGWEKVSALQSCLQFPRPAVCFLGDLQPRMARAPPFDLACLFQEEY